VLDAILSNSKYLGGIISFEDYFSVQVEKGKLSGLFVCEECGAVYWRITRPSGEIVWRCSNKVKDGKRICQHAPSILEDDLKQAVCEILDMPEFDPQAVKEHLECIRIDSDGSLTPEFIQREYMEIIL
jgi:hypothetical protein